MERVLYKIVCLVYLVSFVSLVLTIKTKQTKETRETSLSEGFRHQLRKIHYFDPPLFLLSKLCCSQLEIRLAGWTGGYHSIYTYL